MDYSSLATQEKVDAAIAGLKSRNFDALAVSNGKDALAKIKELIPKGASVMNGASTTLEQIGFVEYLKEGAHGWNNLHASILAETDQAKQADLRKQSVISDYYLGSVHAMSVGGEMVIASNTGSQLPHLAYTSPNLILVVSTKKIMPDLAGALERLEAHVIPLEDTRLMGVYNAHTQRSKTLILHKENPMMGRRVLVIFVHEDLGF